MRILKAMGTNREFRVALARASHFWFFHSYLSHYATHPTADFQRDIFALTERKDSGAIVIVAFRQSSKSTICTLSYPLWAILGKEQKKFIVILSQTQKQALLHLSNIKAELERNELLRQDLGPFKEESSSWGGQMIVIPRYDARIVAVSMEQGIRGARHRQYRPDVIIADDVEDIDSVRTQEGRNKTYEKFKGDILPMGSLDAKKIIVGNLLHEDSLLRRLQDEIESGELEGIFREYPLLDPKDVPLWPGKYTSPEMIKKERRGIGNENAWQREFLLKIVSAEDQVVYREWIHYYKNDDFPSYNFDKYSWTKVGIDLAISTKQTADYTAMVVGSLFGRYGDAKLYIHAFPVNERMNFPAALEKAIEIAKTTVPGKSIGLLVEEVGYQPAFTETLKGKWIDAEGVRVGSLDKRSRLSLVSHLIKNGIVLFPRKGCEVLINQIVGLGVEKHDDLVDAFVILASYVLDNMRPHAFGVEKIDRI